MARLAIHAVVSIALMLASSPGRAMDFKFEPLGDKPPQGVILAQGNIQPGDDEKLHDLVAALPGNTTLTGIALSSPGGNLVEGVHLATTIRNTGLATGVLEPARPPAS